MDFNLKNFERLPQPLFRLLFWNLLFSIVPLACMLGLFALFDLFYLHFNRQYFFGIKAFFILVFGSPVLVVVIAVLLWSFLKIGNSVLKFFIRF